VPELAKFVVPDPKAIVGLSNNARRTELAPLSLANQKLTNATSTSVWNR
jgi:hypothetical protein